MSHEGEGEYYREHLADYAKKLLRESAKETAPPDTPPDSGRREDTVKVSLHNEPGRAFLTIHLTAAELDQIAAELEVELVSDAALAAYAPVAPPEPTCERCGTKLSSAWCCWACLPRKTTPPVTVAPPATTLDALQENTAGMIHEAFDKLVRPPAGGPREADPELVRQAVRTTLAELVGSPDDPRPLYRQLVERGIAHWRRLAAPRAGTTEREP